MRTIFVLLAVLATSAASADIFIPEDGIRMRISGTISSLQTDKIGDDETYKSYYLNLDTPIVFNDDDICSQIKQERIALNSETVKKYTGKSVVVDGVIFCQEQFTGLYHFREIKVNGVTTP